MKIIRTLIAALTVGLAATTYSAQAQDKGTVGIAMPTKSSLRWISDGNELVKALEEKGYKTDLQFAEDDIPNQLAQIENMVTKDAKVLIIASIDGTTLSAVLQQAHDKGVKVDRLRPSHPRKPQCRLLHHLRQFPGRRSAGEFDPERALAIRKRRGRSTSSCSAARPTTTTPSSSTTAPCSVLQPLIDKGDFVVKSGQMGMDKVGTLRWDGAVAQARMDNLLSANYSDGSRVDAVLAPYDGLSRGIISSLRGVGYGTADQPWPIISGQDAEVPSVKAIIAGEQYSTVYKDTRELAKVTAGLVDEVMRARNPRRSTTPRPTTTASRSCRPCCSPPMRSTSRTTRKWWSIPATSRPRTCK